MIPLPLLTSLPWKAIGWGALVAAVALMGWRVSAWHNAYERLGDVESALEAERLCGEGSACAARQAALEAAQAETTAKVISTYESELAAIRSRPARVVRLCPDSGDVQGAGAARPANGAAPAVIPGPAGRDIGRELYDLAREADEVSARLRALQEWNAALAR
jgi:hypothetical protein